MTTARKRSEESASRSGRSLPPGKTRYPLYRRLDRCGKSRPTGFWSPDRPARSQSLYRLSYPAHLQCGGYFKISHLNKPVIDPTETEGLCGWRHCIADISYSVVNQRKTKRQRAATWLANSVSFVKRNVKNLYKYVTNMAAHTGNFFVWFKYDRLFGLLVRVSGYR